MRGEPGDLDLLLLDHTGEMLLAVDPATLAIVAANRTAEELLGHARGDLIGRPITDLESSLADVFYWEDIRQGERGEVSNVESLYRRGDGDILPVTKDVRRATANGRDWLVLRIRDERERRRGEDNLAQLTSQLKATIEANGDGIMVTSAEGRVVNMNRRFGEMWHIPEDVLDGGDEAITAWLAGQLIDPAAYRRGMATPTQNGQGESFDVLALTGGRYFERRSRPQLLDDRIIGRVHSFHDITERVEHERELIDLRDRAEQASRAKSQFLAAMSHEIRTPMNGILGMAQLLLQPELKEKERAEYARTVLKSGQTLLALLNDILDLSKIEAGRLDLAHAAVDPRQIMEEMTDLFAGTAQAKGLAITADWTGPPNPRYLADPLRLRQILSNLVSNALKFTEAGLVRIQALEIRRLDDKAWLEFVVTDSGIGIPESKLNLLFEPFSQVDASTTRIYGGTGLGLSIVRSLIELMRGEYGVTSEEGRGSRFWFRVPVDLARPEEGGGAANHAPAPPSRGTEFEAARGRILVVEDNPTNRKVIEAMLGRMNVRIRCVENGEQALAAISAGEAPDLVFMDCQMPVMDGFEATTRIRAWERHHQHPRIPIVALTAGVFREDRERCAAVGMDGFLDKPVDFNKLATMVTHWLKANRSIQEDGASAGPVNGEKPPSGTLPIFDEALLLTQLSGDRQLAATIFASVLGNMSNHLDRLDHAVATRDMKAAESAIHTMKSLVGQAGGTALFNRMKAAHARLRAGESMAEGEANELRQAYDALAALLRAWRP